MKRQLYIIRHGKSSWDKEGLDDIDRPLSDRGIRSAEMMAGRLREKGLIPRLIFTSPASRALNTALIMKRTWGLDPSMFQVQDELYLAGVEEIARVVERAPGEIGSLAIFGHNPSFTMYANNFLKSPLDNLPTAGVVVVTLESESWKGVGRKQVTATHVDFPRR
jgi:phosphohistidine phosphatase